MQQGSEELPITTGAISNAYTVVLRKGYLEIYENAKGDYTTRETPDVVFDPHEVQALAHFLVQNNSML